MFPGQGSQKKGMAAELFEEFADMTAKADAILGYSIRELCVEDPKKQLMKTQFTQPALYTVNAFSFLAKQKEDGPKPDFLAGHSLGEYNALFAAGSFDFETGLRLVQKRGDLMSKAKPGGMAAVMRMDEEKIGAILKDKGLDAIDIANFNSPDQIVISGPKQEIERAQPIFEEIGGERSCIIIKVGSAFHSRYMQEARDEFAAFLAAFDFADPNTPVISNVEARPYPPGKVKELLAAQITSSVKWTETVRYLMGKGEEDFVEIGPGRVLTGLTRQIRRKAEPLVVEDEPAPPAPADPAPAPAPAPSGSESGGIAGQSLGSAGFRQEYGLTYACAAGSMSHGVSSKELTVAMGKAGMLAFYGSEGLPLDRVESDIRAIQQELGAGGRYGVNLPANIADPTAEDALVDLLLKLGVGLVEATGFLQMTPALVRYRLHGARKRGDGGFDLPNRVIGRAARPEVASAFMSPAPERIVKKLLDAGKITGEQAEAARTVPVAADLCAAADGGGPTDQSVAYALMPAMFVLRQELADKHGYDRPIYLGASGGVGAPEAAAAAFTLGADFIMTGYVNQCTVESGANDAVKSMLQDINVQDTAYAPDGELFEMGAKAQVLKKGLFFPARANKLYALYQHYGSLEELDAKTRDQLQNKYFKRSFDQIWEEVKNHLRQTRPDEIQKAEQNPKHRMLHVFKWYFRHGRQLALSGSAEQKVDYLVYCGAASGALNQWLKATPFESWRQRRVAEVSAKLMTETADLLNSRFAAMTGAR